MEGVGEAEERLKIACLHCSLNQNSAACEQYDIVEQSLKTLDVDQRMRIALSVRIGRGILHSSMVRLASFRFSLASSSSSQAALAWPDLGKTRKIFNMNFLGRNVAMSWGTVRH